VNGLISMSPHELSRTEVMQQLKAKQVTQAQAAASLGLTVRQVKRLWRAYRAGGAKAILSKRRGQPSNNRLAADVKDQARQLIGQHYADFGPTLAHEKLTEVHSLTLSVETVRKLTPAPTAGAVWWPTAIGRPSAPTNLKSINYANGGRGGAS